LNFDYSLQKHCQEHHYSQGNEDCGITWFGTDWNDAPCVEKYHSICEIGKKLVGFYQRAEL
jgi:hypothetical protein